MTEDLIERIRQGENTAGIEPVEYRVLLLNQPVEKKTGLIEKPQQVVEQETWAQTQGYVVAISDMAFTGDNGKKWSCELPWVGAKVVFSKYAGQLIEIEDVVYRMVSDKDILAVVKS